MNPEYPIYIPSKGRWDYRLTMITFDKMNVPYYVIIEEQEYSKYLQFIDKKKLLILPKKYIDDYDPCDDYDLKSKGSGPARNFAWDHSNNLKAFRHWLIDDNIYSFMRFNRNHKIKVACGTIFRVMEIFCDRYENIAFAGPDYHFFAPRKHKFPAFIMNTRIYSCILIRNDLPYRWRGRYNEDTDISLRALKDGWVTIQFYAFLQQKVKTMTLKGGNTDLIYQDDGRLKMAESLVRRHPDVARIGTRYGRNQHFVDYRPFKRNKLILKKGVELKNEVNEFGMVLKQFSKNRISELNI
jgi:hypothetical protein